jgi:hypothetical protein
MATQTAASTSYADVNTAMGLCNNGDTLIIPVGSVTWASTLTITKNLTIIGGGNNGSSTTTISYSTGTIFTFAPVIDANCKVAFIKFDKTVLKTSSSPSVTITAPFVVGRLWFDNCTFIFGSDVVFSTVRSYGLFSNCTFTDCEQAVPYLNVTSGDGGAAEWALGRRLGTDQTWVLEDCTINFTAASDGASLDEFVYGQEGTRMTMRHCTYTSSGRTVIQGPFDMHGYWSSYGDGVLAYEVYSNTFALNSNAFQIVSLRGGTIMFYDNTVTSANASQIFFRTRNEGFTNAAPFLFNATDQINNSYIYNNTLGGVTQASLANWASEPGFFNADPDTGGAIFAPAGNAWSLYNAAAWVTATPYVQAANTVLPSYVSQNGNLYRCLISHTSGTFATDLAAGKWIQDDWHFYTRTVQSGDPIYPYSPLRYPHPLREPFTFKRLSSHIKFKGLAPV